MITHHGEKHASTGPHGKADPPYAVHPRCLASGSLLVILLSQEADMHSIRFVISLLGMVRALLSRSDSRKSRQMVTSLPKRSDSTVTSQSSNDAIQRNICSVSFMMGICKYKHVQMHIDSEDGAVRIPDPTTFKTSARHKQANHYSSSFQAFDIAQNKGHWRKA